MHRRRENKVVIRKDEDLMIISGDDSEGEPPVPMPNTEVKPFNADNTWLETAREDRKLPDPMKRTATAVLFFLCCDGRAF